MNPQEAAFIAYIREHPDDDTPRLIFSDWLQENGEEKRAAFIRIQCELARGPYTQDGKFIFTGLADRTDYLRRAEREFIIEYGIDELAPYWIWASLYPTKFRRGFIEAVELPAEYWIEHGDAICAATPLREVQLTTMLMWDDWKEELDLIDHHKLVDGKPVYRTLKQGLAIRWPGVRFQMPPVGTDWAERSHWAEWPNTAQTLRVP